MSKTTETVMEAGQCRMEKEAIPECWQRVEGCFVPNEEHSTYIKQFRTISLLSF